MRWVEGTNLRDLIDRGPLEPTHAVRLVSQVASALDAAHERGLIHRDVKPANILIAEEDHVYLTDFGLTKHASSISGLTRPGQWVGTVDYTAPEQIEGAEVTPRTDVYSLGCVLFEALAGRPPHRRENELATLWAHMYTQPPPVREAAPGRTRGVRRRRAARDGQGSRGALRVRGRARPGGAGRAHGEMQPAPRAVRRRSACSAGESGPTQPWLRSRGDRAGESWPASRGLLVDRGCRGDRVPRLDRTIRARQRRPGRRLAVSPPLAASPPTGAAAAPMPTARQNMDGTVLDGTIWVVGGLGEGASVAQHVEGYDPVINGWKSAPDLPVRLHHEMVVDLQGRAGRDGRLDPAGIRPERADLRPGVRAARRQWVQLPPLHRPRAAGAAAVVGDGSWSWAARTTGAWSTPQRCSTASDGATARTCRRRASTSRRPRTGEFVYAVGGRALGPDENSAALERYDPDDDSWQRLPDMPTARGGLGAAIAGGHLFAVGGESPTRVLAAVQSYDIASKAWSNAPSMRTPRHGTTMDAIGRSLYSLGGAQRPGHASASATAEVLRLTR